MKRAGRLFGAVSVQSLQNSRMENTAIPIMWMAAATNIRIRFPIKVENYHYGDDLTIDFTGTAEQIKAPITC